MLLHNQCHDLRSRVFRLIHSIFLSLPAVFAAVPCKLFVLLEGPSVTTAAAADPAAGAAAAAVPVPAGFTIKRQFRLSMRKGTHVRLLLGQRADEEAAEERQRPAGEGQQPPSSEASMDGSGNCCSTGEGAGESMATVHLSQLPDADSQVQVEGLGPQHSSGACLPAAAGAAPQGASSTAGSVWFMARTVLKGLNSGSGSDGMAAGFDGL